MSFQLRKATLPDAPAITDTYFDAFGNHPVTRRVFKTRSEDVQTYWIKSLEAEIQDPNAHYLVITDVASSTPERVIAFGKWRKPLTPTSPPSPPALDWPEGADLVFIREFLGMIDRKHEEITKGRPHWYLEILGVRKEHQGRGAGKQIVNWGLDQADEAGVEAFLAASPAGAPLYLKLGFELLETVYVDDGKYLESFMLRQPRKPHV
ncbi:hypothetical protein AAE478_005129 [Parahypoxylon ruwenzoriense]